MQNIIANDFKEQVRNVNPIEEVIGEHIALKRNGKVFQGNCIKGHDNKTPSFTVYPDTQTFYCFGCGISGDVFTFVMLKQGIDFPGALKYLAEKKGIVFPIALSYEKECNIRKIEPVLSEAAYLYNKGMSPAIRKYLNKRGLSDTTIDKYLIGFCDGKCSYKSEKSALLEAGLIYDNGNNYFKGYITFPHFYHGRVVYISGRGYPEKKHKKLQADKVSLDYLYNEDALRKQEVIICEGEIDTLTLSENGFNACGVLGVNSFKEEWVYKFKYCRKVYISFDGDEAGRKGALKVAELLGSKSRIITLPQGEDVNDFFNTNKE